MYRMQAINCRPGYHRVYGKTTNRATEASVFSDNLSKTGWGREDCGQNRLDMMVPSGRYGYKKRIWRQVTPLILSSCAARGRARYLRAQRLKTGTWEPQASACNGRQAIRGDRGRMFCGAEAS